MQQQTERMNVIWILGDQHRAQALSSNGDPNVNTPNIDRLAANGVNFDHAVSGFPLCCPFRGSMLTSRYPHQCVPGHEYRLPPEQPTIADAFGEAGYDTAYFGKWHLDGCREAEEIASTHYIPPERRGGFQQWVGYENNNNQWNCKVHGHDAQGNEIPLYRLPGYETDCLTDLLIAYLKQRGSHSSTKDSQPFFAVLSVQPPHDPYVAPAENMAKFNPAALQMRPNVPDVDRVQKQARRELAGAYAQIDNLDWNVGRILEALRENDLLFDTHILFFSDHGDMHGSHGQFRKTSPFEESIRIPFIIGGERPHILGGSERVSGRSDYPVNHVDIAPTTLGLCGIPVPDWMQGFDYSAARYRDGALPASSWPDSAYLQGVIPTGHGDSIDKPWRGIVTRDGWKYVCLEGADWLLFNLNEDPYEQVNLAHNSYYWPIRRALHDRLEKWIKDTADEFCLPSA